MEKALRSDPVFALRASRTLLQAAERFGDARAHFIFEEGQVVGIDRRTMEKEGAAQPFGAVTSEGNLLDYKIGAGKGQEAAANTLVPSSM